MAQSLKTQFSHWVTLSFAMTKSKTLV